MLVTAPKPAEPRGRPWRSFRGIFTRYTIGSVLAGVASEVALVATYGPGLLGPHMASIVGWSAGAVLNYGLNRWWVWGHRGRADPVRELLPYWAVTLATLVLSAWATGAADRLGHRLIAGGPLRVAFVAVAFLAVYGLMFGVKFVVYHYVVFAPRSRHQVVRTVRR